MGEKSESDTFSAVIITIQICFWNFTEVWIPRVENRPISFRTSCAGLKMRKQDVPASMRKSRSSKKRCLCQCYMMGVAKSPIQVHTESNR